MRRCDSPPTTSCVQGRKLAPASAGVRWHYFGTTLPTRVQRCGNAAARFHFSLLTGGSRFSITQTSHASGDPDANAIRRPSGWSLR